MGGSEGMVGADLVGPWGEFCFYFKPVGKLLEKEMTTHSATPAWRIPWKEEPGRLQPMGSQRVGHDRATSLTHSLKQWNGII